MQDRGQYSLVMLPATIAHIPQWCLNGTSVVPQYCLTAECYCSWLLHTYILLPTLSGESIIQGVVLSLKLDDNIRVMPVWGCGSHVAIVATIVKLRERWRGGNRSLLSALNFYLKHSPRAYVEFHYCMLPSDPSDISSKYTIRSIVCKASCHSVPWSLGHSVTRSLGHLVTWSLSHMITIFNMATNWWTNWLTTLGLKGLLRRQ